MFFKITAFSDTFTFLIWSTRDLYIDVGNSELSTDTENIEISNVIDLNSKDDLIELNSWHIKNNSNDDIDLEKAWTDGEFDSLAVYNKKHFYKLTFEKAIGCLTNEYKLDLIWAHKDNAIENNSSLYFYSVEYESVSH